MVVLLSPQSTKIVLSAKAPLLRRSYENITQTLDTRKSSGPDNFFGGFQQGNNLFLNGATFL